MEPKRLYTVRWTQQYPVIVDSELIRALYQMRDALVEEIIDHGDLTEAKQELERIMKL